MRTFKQITQQDRVYISRLRTRGLNLTQIAQRLGVHKSTISRELKRNAQVSDHESQVFWLAVSNLWSKEEVLQHLERLKNGSLPTKYYWTANDAQRTRDHRHYLANQIRRRKNPETAKWVIQKLKEHWSPEQIAGRSKIDGPQQISHEFVYQLIITNRKKGGTLYRLLKRFGKRKQRLGVRVYGALIPNRTSIEQRPKEANNRARIGDVETDLIAGYCSDGFIVTTVDRKSKMTVLRKSPNKKKRNVRRQQEIAFKKLKIVHTCTEDNGSEFADHETLTKNTGVPVYFTHPYSSCERGTVENTNGLVRYFLPKKTKFAKLTQTQLNQIEDLLNNRPRKCLGFLTPKEVHFNQVPRPPGQRFTRQSVAFDS